MNLRRSTLTSRRSLRTAMTRTWHWTQAQQQGSSSSSRRLRQLPACTRPWTRSATTAPRPAERLRRTDSARLDMRRLAPRSLCRHYTQTATAHSRRVRPPVHSLASRASQARHQARTSRLAPAQLGQVRQMGLVLALQAQAPQVSRACGPTRWPTCHTRVTILQAATSLTRSDLANGDMQIACTIKKKGWYANKEVAFIYLLAEGWRSQRAAGGCSASRQSGSQRSRTPQPRRGRQRWQRQSRGVHLRAP